MPLLRKDLERELTRLGFVPIELYISPFKPNYDKTNRDANLVSEETTRNLL